MQAQAKAIPATHPLTTHKVVFISLLAISIYVLLISPALATSGVNTPMGYVLCQIVKFVYGNLGRGLATLAIMVVGVGATLGKVSWGLAITVAVGVSVVFNASVITSLLVNSSGFGASAGACT